MTVFIRKLSELGSDRSQDVAMSPWRLSIFVSQGNISKPADPTAGAELRRADAKCVFLQGDMNFSWMLIKRLNCKFQGTSITILPRNSVASNVVLTLVGLLLLESVTTFVLSDFA